MRRRVREVRRWGKGVGSLVRPVVVVVSGAPGQIDTSHQSRESLAGEHVAFHDQHSLFLASSLSLGIVAFLFQFL